MKVDTYYSILFVQPRPASGERIAIGLFVWDEYNCRFAYSISRLELMKKILNEPAYNLLKDGLKAITKNMNQHVSNQNSIYKEKKEAYFDYLSRMGNNLLGYSPPQSVQVPFGEEAFKMLYGHMIGPVYELATKTTKKIRFRQQVERQLKSQIQDQVDFEFELNSQHFREIVAPITVPFIGKNDSIVTGSIIDFNSDVHVINGAFQRFFGGIYYPLKEEGQQAHHFLIANEPSSNIPDTIRTLLNDIKGKQGVDLVWEHELDKVTNYVKEHNVRPFSELISSQ